MNAAHALRLASVAALGWIVHAEHSAWSARQAGASLTELPMPQISRHLPAAAAMGGDSGAVAGGRELLDQAGRRIGTIFRTSPEGDAALGFSGPTDLLVVLDADLRVAGVEILSSGDTRDHVAAIARDEAFFAALRGRSLEELAALAARGSVTVAGSTLTSLAIAESLSLRLGAAVPGRFPATAPTLADLQTIYPAAEAIEPDAGDPAVIRVRGAAGIPLGWALRTSPAADQVIGYQGPTDALIGFDPTGLVAGVAVLESFDNEPYVGYVRDDRRFRHIYRGLSLEALAGIDPLATGIEGVSGATMTSQAVAEGIVRAARAARSTGGSASWPTLLIRDLDGPRLGALALIAVAIVTAFTRARGGFFGRIALPVAVLAYLGFGAGALLSQAQIWGWAQAGVPRGAIVLLALGLAAVILPATTRHNVYCSHLCAHGAAQRLLLRFARPQGRVPARLRPFLAALPWALLAAAVLSALFHLPLALVDLEPFDAYLPTVAGPAALAIFAVGLAASARWPMAYCRHACPTGALLDHLRLNARSDRFTWRDGMLVACLVAGVVAHSTRISPARPPAAAGATLPTLAGPAMGTTYRVTLAGDLPGRSRGEVHRAIEEVLARIDGGLNTWRDDSDASGFNRAPAGEWVEVGPDLLAVVGIARRVHEETGGAFDLTFDPAGSGRVAGMELVESRLAPPGIRKTRSGVRLDLGGIGPGYGVDEIGTRLEALGSTAHLVELGGEVRAWGAPPTGGRWRVRVRGGPEVLELAPGEAVATSTVRPGRSPVDPRTGRVVAPRAASARVRGPSCAEADARAVARLVLDAGE